MAGRMEDKTLGGLIRSAMDARLEGLFTALPGRVVSYDAEKQEAEVLPTIRRPIKTYEGETTFEDLPVIPAVPVVFPSAGGFRLTLPVREGDPVLLVFSMRSLADWRRTGEVTNPSDLRPHHIGGAVAIPGLLPAEDSGAHGDHLVLGRKGGPEVHITPSEVRLGSEDASRGVGRVGDQVSVTVPMNTIAVPNPAGGPPIPNPAPLSFSGTITAGSTKVKAD